MKHHIKYSILFIFPFLLSACQTSVISDSDISTFKKSPVKDEEITVIMSEESYNPKDVKVNYVNTAEYSGNFKPLSENPKIKKVIEKIVGFSNTNVDPNDFQNAYALPSQFIDNINNIDFDSINYEQMSGNPQFIIKEIKRYDFKDVGNVTSNDLKEDAQNNDFFQFNVSRYSNSEKDIDFFGKSKSMNN
jgi:hypothetical protein